MAVIIDTFREGYGPDQVRRTMTVGELIRFLQNTYDEDEEIYLGFDRRWTYGGITEYMFDEIDEADE